MPESSPPKKRAGAKSASKPASRSATQSNTAQTKSQAKSPAGMPSRLLLAVTALYTMCLAFVLASYAAGPEHWWATGMNLYLPQWLWGLPLPALLLWYLLRARRGLWLPLIPLFLVIGPIMGMSWHFINHSAPRDKGLRLRVMTYNIKWAKGDVKAIENDIDTYKPDLMLMQDAGNALGGDLGQYLKGWNIQNVDQYIIASRLPLSDMDVRWISYPEHNHRVERCLLHANGRNIVVYSCHLASPRFALAGMKHPRAGLASLQSNLDFRVRESERLAEHVRSETLPILLTGDLNAPTPSLVCKNLFEAGLTDAFSAAGAGYGYTYGVSTKVGHSYVRIDHIMVSPQWQILGCWVGNDSGSDHCPVIADVYLPKESVKR